MKDFIKKFKQLRRESRMLTVRNNILLEADIAIDEGRVGQAEILLRIEENLWKYYEEVTK